MTQPCRPGRRPTALASLLPLASIMWASSVGQDERVSGSDLFTVGVTCFSSGIVWQLLYRRDLTDRLTYISSWFVIGVLVFLPTGWKSEISISTGFGLAVVGVVAGLVYGEQWLRWRERASRSPRGREQVAPVAEKIAL